MGINTHVFNFIHSQALLEPLGDVLTIGRQEVCVPSDHLRNSLGSCYDGFASTR